MFLNPTLWGWHYLNTRKEPGSTESEKAYQSSPVKMDKKDGKHKFSRWVTVFLFSHKSARRPPFLWAVDSFTLPSPNTAWLTRRLWDCVLGRCETLTRDWGWECCLKAGYPRKGSKDRWCLPPLCCKQLNTGMTSSFPVSLQPSMGRSVFGVYTPV